MRISYNDYKLFQRIAESVSNQLSKAMKNERTGSEPPKVKEIQTNSPYVHGMYGPVIIMTGLTLNTFVSKVTLLLSASRYQIGLPFVSDWSAISFNSIPSRL